MFLKNISLRGFKSFAKKSILELKPGITVIVGPNGSGKSNIADAVSWVLGEQSPRSLRSSSMEDIIFRSRNEEFGIAEVSLTFDNRDKFLPFEFDEVKITRRLYQKGGSEYFINSTPVRLLDILDLTSEQGIGKGLYTIVNQGEIDEVAGLKPFERKVIIDEILGIAKHKQKRDKAKNKLQKVYLDIERIKDLMLEIKKTMDPLEIESKKAQKYFEVFNMLKDIEISLFLAELKNYNLLWKKQNEEIEKINNEIKRIDKNILKTENDKINFETKQKENSVSFEELKKKNNIMNNLKNKIDSSFQLALSKKNSLITLESLISSQIKSLKNSFNNLDSLNNISSKSRAAYSTKKDDTSYEKKYAEIYDNNYFEDSNNFTNLNFNANDDDNDNKLKIINNKFLKVKTNLLSFFNRIKALIKDDIKINELDNDFSIILDELESLKNLFLSNNKNFNQQNKEINFNVFKINIDTKIKNLTNIKDFCCKIIFNIDNLYKILSKLRRVFEDLNYKFYLDFEEIVKNLNNYNSKLEEYVKDIADLKYKKQNLENELYRLNIQKERVSEKVKDLSEEIVENYNISIDFITKNYQPAKNLDEAKNTTKKLKNELKQFGSINPNATADFEALNKRYKFLEKQKVDLIESKKDLEKLIEEINQRIKNIFNIKFEEINNYFKIYFNLLFPLGKGELYLQHINLDGDDDFGIELKVDIGNSKVVPLSLLSGGEKALVSIAFLFSTFAANFSPFYIFDEIDASLDDMNLNRFVNLLKGFSKNRQVLIISHQKKTMEIADYIFGVTMQSNGVSKVVSERISKDNATVN